MTASSSKIFIATPTAGGRMLADYVASLARMIAQLHERGIGTDYRTVKGPNLVLQRDMLADAFLKSDATHLLFIDSDMAFAPDLAERLLSFARPVIGTIYPRRNLDLARLKSLIPAHGFDHALALAHDWNVRFLGPQLEVRGGLCKVEGIGFGFTLIERACLEELAQVCPTYPNPLTGAPVRAFFREMNDGTGERLDLDYSFCKRWVGRGGDVWAFVDADIRHVGDFRYGMPFMAYLAALGAGTPQTPAPETPAPEIPAPDIPAPATREQETPSLPRGDDGPFAPGGGGRS
jgi:hypothetical protein